MSLGVHKAWEKWRCRQYFEKVRPVPSEGHSMEKDTGLPSSSSHQNMGRNLMRRQVMFTGANAAEKENQALFLLGEDTHGGALESLE